MDNALFWLNRLVWGVPTILLILGTGLFLSLRTGFPQIRLFPRALKLFFRKLRPGKAKDGAVSPFQALCTALAATVGTGNLAGVAGAIAIGGPGAIFWMWICAFLGMATKYAEATLAVRWRCRDANGDLVGGPMYMIRDGMGKKWAWLATIYSFFGVVAAFGVGNATQVNAVISSVDEAIIAFGGAPNFAGNLLLGILLAALVGFMLSGGLKRIGNIAQLLVPVASVAYILLSIGILAVRWNAIPAAFNAIFQGAFDPKAVTGGALGSAFVAMRVGISRGVFTNEAGMGTASIAHAAADVEHPSEQGLMGMMEVFLDTIVICTVTALVILCSGIPIGFGEDLGVVLTTQAFSSVYGSWISLFLAAALCCFAIATVLGWGLYGIRCAQYLLGSQVGNRFVALQAGIVVLGAVLKTGTVWTLSEIVNGLMAIPNLIALIALAPELTRLTREYKRKRGDSYEYIHQRKPLRALSHAEVPPPGSGSGKQRKENLPSEYRTA